MVGNGFHNQLHRYRLVVAGNDVLQRICRQINVNHAFFAESATRDHAVQRAFQLAHVLFHILRDKGGGIFFQHNANGVGFALQNIHAHFQFRRF